MPRSETPRTLSYRSVARLTNVFAAEHGLTSESTLEAFEGAVTEAVMAAWVQDKSIGINRFRNAYIQLQEFFAEKNYDDLGAITIGDLVEDLKTAHFEGKDWL